MTRTCGWQSDFPQFRDAEPRVIRAGLSDFIRDASPEQETAWARSIPWLQSEVGEVIDEDPNALGYTAILEYRLPLDSRRPDAVLLLPGAVVVVELKGKEEPSAADLDQVGTYARDLRCYHAHCQDRPVHAILVPTRGTAPPTTKDAIHIVAPRDLDQVVRGLYEGPPPHPVDPEQFLDVGAYRPLPSLVTAARELFESHKVRDVWRARASTDPAVETISRIAHEAARTKTRRLVLVTGVPGSGKTLVGLRAVHARYLDDLAEEREGKKVPAPGIFLSGNGPLVEVLQYQLRGAGGGGQTFVRAVKSYLETHVPRTERIPPHHVIVFDEAQRAFTPDKVADLHADWPSGLARSEPAHFIEICDRIPGWCLMVGLIGTGQEIHVGEEGGIRQWSDALRDSPYSEAWTVHAPASVVEVFQGSGVRTCLESTLQLDTEVRFHLTPKLHQFVEGMLAAQPADQLASIAESLRRPDPDCPGGVALYATRNLEIAKQYLRDRYDQHADARFGIIASSKDKVLEALYGVPTGFQATKRVRRGPWFVDGEESQESCRHLRDVVTEFGAQGLELDMALLAWGTDFMLTSGVWSNARARGYRSSVPIRDPFQLRLNAYRVLLTRGRDGTVLFVPPECALDETWDYVRACGFRELP